MTSRFLRPLLPFLLLLLQFSFVLSQCPDVLTLTDKVINGNPSIPSYQISLSSPPNPAIRRCTASRIAPEWALTAAHCNVNSSWTAAIAGHTVSSGEEARVIQVHTYPKYLQPTDRRFDIALIQLSTDSTPTEDAFVMLNDHPAIPFPDAFVRVAGYGATDTSATPAFGNLTHVDIPTVPFAECERLYRGTPNLGTLDSANQLCAGYPQGGCDACSGDSGGPVVQFDNKGRAVQVALVSASRGCALPGFPGIGVRIDAFLPWIREFGVQFSVGRGMQVLKASGGRLVTKDPPSDVAQDEKDTPRESVSQTPNPKPSASSSPIVVVTTPKPARPEQPVDNRLPSPSPPVSPVAQPKPTQPKPTQPKPTKPGKDQGVGAPLGPRLPPLKPTPQGEETLDEIEKDDDDVGASAEPDGQKGALAGDVAIGSEISGSTPVGAIAGGVVGGLVLVALVIAGFVFLGKSGADDGQTDSDNTADVETDPAQDVEAAQEVES